MERTGGNAFDHRSHGVSGRAMLEARYRRLVRRRGKQCTKRANTDRRTRQAAPRLHE